MKGNQQPITDSPQKSADPLPPGDRTDKNSRGKNVIIFVLLILLILASGAAIYLLWDRNGSSTDSNTTESTGQEQESMTDTIENDAEGEEAETSDESEVSDEGIEGETGTDSETTETETFESECEFYLTEASSPGSGEIFTRWVAEGCDTTNGYRVLRSTSGIPVYPGDDYRDVTDGDAEFAVWTENVSGTYQVRMCLVGDDEGCDMYTSNTESVTVL